MIWSHDLPAFLVSFTDLCDVFWVYLYFFSLLCFSTEHVFLYLWSIGFTKVRPIHHHFLLMSLTGCCYNLLHNWTLVTLETHWIIIIIMAASTELLVWKSSPRTCLCMWRVQLWWLPLSPPWGCLWRWWHSSQASASCEMAFIEQDV